VSGADERPPLRVLSIVQPAKPYRGAGGYLFALDQVRNAMKELVATHTSHDATALVGRTACAYAYLVDAERALDDAITETPPLPESHGERRRR